MKRITAFLLVLLMLLGTFTMPVQAKEATRKIELPGLGVLYDTEAVLIEEDEGDCYYAYATDGTLDEIVACINAYNVLLQEEGFTWQKLEADTLENVVYFAAITKDDVRAEVAILFEGYVTEAQTFEDSVSSWIIFLGVPKEMTLVELRSDLPEDTAPAENELPGPGTLLGMQGKFLEEDEGYLYYYYVFECSLKELGEFSLAYEAELEQAGYTWEIYDADNAEDVVLYIIIRKEGFPQTEFCVFFDGYVEKADTMEDSVCSWTLMLAMPDELNLAERVPEN